MNSKSDKHYINIKTIRYAGKKEYNAYPFSSLLYIPSTVGKTTFRSEKVIDCIVPNRFSHI